MKYSSLSALGIGALFALSSASVPSASPAVIEGGPEVGSVIDFKFSTPPLNSDGMKSLAELRGRPVLIEFWGTR